MSNAFNAEVVVDDAFRYIVKVTGLGIKEICV